MDPHRATFDAFCAEHQIEPTDRDYFFWLAALRSTRLQQPVAFGYFSPAGTLMTMLDFIEPGRRPAPTPLYADPVAPISKPDIPQETLNYVWRTAYQPDGDLIGFVRWVEKVSKSMN